MPWLAGWFVSKANEIRRDNPDGIEETPMKYPIATTSTDGRYLTGCSWVCYGVGCICVSHGSRRRGNSDVRNGGMFRVGIQSCNNKDWQRPFVFTILSKLGYIRARTYSVLPYLARGSLNI